MSPKPLALSQRYPTANSDVTPNPQRASGDSGSWSPAVLDLSSGTWQFGIWPPLLFMVSVSALWSIHEVISLCLFVWGVWLSHVGSLSCAV